MNLSFSAQLAALLVKSLSRSALRRTNGLAALRTTALATRDTKILVAPPNLLCSDAAMARDLYKGRFDLGGAAFETRGKSPFLAPPPSEAWLRALHSFDWLGHLIADGASVTRLNGQALIKDWIAAESLAPQIAFAPSVLSNRIQAWLTASPFLLADADPAFYRRFSRSLVAQIHQLSLIADSTKVGVERFVALSTLLIASLSLSSSSHLMAARAGYVDQEIERQILSDGGHISRSPEALVEVASRLIVVRQMMKARDLAPSAQLLAAIERIMPMLRFFRVGDGTLSRFNSTSHVSAAQLDQLLSFDETKGAPVSEALASGFQRLEQGQTCLIMDVGLPPPLAYSERAHAGTLGFELSSGSNLLVVNCGTTKEDHPVWREVTRATAAHSTLCLADTSSCQTLPSGWLASRLGRLVLAGPSQVSIRRQRPEKSDDADLLSASHDGYLKAHGLYHERTVLLSSDGYQLVGRDILKGQSASQQSDAQFSKGSSGEPPAFALRFHLHPSVEATPSEGEERVYLKLPSGETWTFSAMGAVCDLEESLFFSSFPGPQKTCQIVLSGKASANVNIDWQFTKMVRQPRSSGSIETPGLPLPPLLDPDFNSQS